MGRGPLPASASGVFLFQTRNFGGQSDLQDLIHLFHPVKLHGTLDQFGKISQITTIVGGQNSFKDAARAVRREQLFFQSANGQNLASQSNLARHCDVAPNFDLGQSASECGRQGNTS